MRVHARALQVALTAILHLVVSPAFVGTSAAQQSNSHTPKPKETDHVRLSTPVVKAWREIPVGSPVYALDDAVGEKDWLERSLIQRIDAQVGVWYIWPEHGYSVFRIYPYLSESSPQPSIYQGIVLKLNGNLSVDDLLVAIRKRTPTTRIDSYDVFGADRVKVQRYSRPHD